MARTTIHDVARRAGVSHTTVSWAIKDDPRITADTKRRVLQAIDELDYHPNYLARSLVSGKTNTIALVAVFFSTVFESQVLQGVERELAVLNLDYIVNQYSTGGSTKRKNETLRAILFGRRADAVILLNTVPEQEIVEKYRQEGIPLILIEVSVPGAYSVKMDNTRGARLATEYLITRGARRIGLVLGRREGEEAGSSPGERLIGYRQALGQHGLAYEVSRVFEVFHYYLEEGRAVLHDLLDSHPDTDAIFCAAGDMVAMGILAEARELGIDIPGRFALVGYDDIFASALVVPALTTLRQPLEELGRRAIDFAIEAISKAGVDPQTVIYQPELVVRDSA